MVIRRSPYLDLALPGSNVRPGPGNTAIKAALAFFHYTGLLAGADITVYKSVPVRPVWPAAAPTLRLFWWV